MRLAWMDCGARGDRNLRCCRPSGRHAHGHRRIEMGHVLLRERWSRLLTRADVNRLIELGPLEKRGWWAAFRAVPVDHR